MMPYYLKNVAEFFMPELLQNAESIRRVLKTWWLDNRHRRSVLLAVNISSFTMTKRGDYILIVKQF